MGFPQYSIQPTSLIQRRLFPELKTAVEGIRFKAVSSIQQTKENTGKPFSWALNLLYERCKRRAKAGRDRLSDGANI
jgi:hypothetical protein